MNVLEKIDKEIQHWETQKEIIKNLELKYGEIFLERDLKHNITNNEIYCENLVGKTTHVKVCFSGEGKLFYRDFIIEKVWYKNVMWELQINSGFMPNRISSIDHNDLMYFDLNIINYMNLPYIVKSQIDDRICEFILSSERNVNVNSLKNVPISLARKIESNLKLKIFQ